MQVPVLKRELRKRIRAKLAALSSEAVAEESRRVCEKVIESDVWKSAKSVALYSSMSAKGEFDTSTLVADALDNSNSNSNSKSRKRVYFPRVISVKERVMHMYECASMDELNSWEVNSWGIKEPPTTIGTPQWEFDLIIMPGVAFDMATRNRCGHGAGFYDTFIKKCIQGRQDNNKKNTPYLLAPVLAAQIVDEVPVDEHDVPVHEIVFD